MSQDGQSTKRNLPARGLSTNESTQKIPLEEWSRMLNAPMASLQNVDLPPEKSLSNIPWKIKWQSTLESKVPTATSESPAFSGLSYLDLRRQQHQSWADKQLEEGMAVLYTEPHKAEESFQRGLGLVSDHVELLMAYGKLLKFTSRPKQALIQWKKVLSIQPDHKVANLQVQVYEQQQQQQQRTENGSRRGVGLAPSKRLPMTRESSVYQDVLMERSLAMDDGDDDVPQDRLGTMANNGNEQKEERVPSKSKRKKHKKDKKRRKKKDRKRQKRKKRRRRRYSSSEGSSCGYSRRSASDSVSESSISSTSSNETSRRRHRKKRRRKRRHDSDASESLSSGGGKSSRSSLDSREIHRNNKTSKRHNDRKSHWRHRDRRKKSQPKDNRPAEKRKEKESGTKANDGQETHHGKEDPDGAK